MTTTIYGGLIFLTGLFLGWLLAQIVLIRRHRGQVRNYQRLQGVLQERNARIQMQKNHIRNRNVAIGNLREVIQNHERVINELKELVLDRMALLRVIEAADNSRDRLQEHRTSKANSDAGGARDLRASSRPGMNGFGPVLRSGPADASGHKAG
jgi:hypothetical protein